ncbi:hypothetical protein HK096_005568, partial [Nowakowskiella sp. JEL0078]
MKIAKNLTPMTFSTVTFPNLNLAPASEERHYSQLKSTTLKTEESSQAPFLFQSRRQNNKTFRPRSCGNFVESEILSKKIADLILDTRPNTARSIKKNQIQLPIPKQRPHTAIYISNELYPELKQFTLQRASSAEVIPLKLELKTEYAYRRYPSVLPCSNLLLAQKWNSEAKQKHEKKIKNVKTYVDTKPPKTYKHLKVRLKKIQLEEDHLDQIEKNNTILLQRMARQMSTPSGISNLNQNNHLKEDLHRIVPNIHKKLETLEKIGAENQLLMQRVEDREPNYRHKQWLDERRQNIAYLQNISRFPEVYMHLFNRSQTRERKNRKIIVRTNRTHLLKQRLQLMMEMQKIDKESTKVTQTSKNRKINIHVTRSVKLKLEHLQAIKNQQLANEERWTGSSKARWNPSTHSAESSNVREGNANLVRSKTPKLVVRLNRAQRLRLEEQELLRNETDDAWRVQHMARLDQVEARINFGQLEQKDDLDGSIGFLLSQNADHQMFLNLFDDKDPLDDPGDLLDHYIQSEPAIRKLFQKGSQEIDKINTSDISKQWTAVLTGVPGLIHGTVIPTQYSETMRIFWCSSSCDTYNERHLLLSRVYPELRQIIQEGGKELFLRDLHWGVSRSILNRHERLEIMKNELESCLKSSYGVS